ncbi:MAG: hypothetical protein HOP36_06860 [Methyloglobulus sp.]|nr:hypothetical protein [Methyloglobulus sp.]
MSWGLRLQAAELGVVVTDKDGKAILDVVVMAMPTEGQTKANKPQKTVVIDQVDKEFVNHVTVIPIDTPVLFPNNDNIRHHVYSFSASKQFELPLYKDTPAKPVTFDKLGVVTLGCNIHDWMVAYIYVTDAPYFSTTNKEGKAQLPNLPAGEYTFRIWHPRMELTEQATQQTAVIKNSGETTLSWQLALKPDLRSRRAPLPIQPGY